MSTIVYFLDVGQGNMALVECANGANFVVDCNITEDVNGAEIMGHWGGENVDHPEYLLRLAELDSSTDTGAW